jgi:hypothetical protein
MMASELYKLLIGMAVVSVIGAIAVPKLIASSPTPPGSAQGAQGPRGGTHWSLAIDRVERHHENDSVEFFVTANNTETGDLIKADIECSVMDEARNVVTRGTATILNIPAGQTRSGRMTASLPTYLHKWSYHCSGEPTRA